MKCTKIRRSNVVLAIICMQCAIAAALPVLQSNSQPDHQPATHEFAWQRTFEGAALAPVELDAKAKAALHRFPGAVALFTDGARYILMRQVTRATRQLHSSADCLKGMGHDIRSRTIITRREDDSHDSHDRRWARFTTDKGIEAFEQIRSQRDHKTWTDVSAWFWDATFHSEDGPWLAVTLFDADFRESADESK